MPTPRYIWSDASGSGRNILAIFRREFRLARLPRSAPMQVFADTRYRMSVNGIIVAYGPARFRTASPEYDSIDLAPHLAPGRNVIEVEVNSFGMNSFEAARSTGGFIAWGAIADGRRRLDLSTPGDWTVARAKAWDENAPPFSLQRNAIEIRDTRLLPTGSGRGPSGWTKPVPLARQDAWGRLRPRSIPLLDLRVLLPERVLFAGALRRELRVGFREDGSMAAPHSRPRSCYATHIHSPVEQEALIGAFWGPHYLNGTEITFTTLPNPMQPNRLEATVRLRKGWNLIYGEPQALTEAWCVAIGLPADLGLSVRGEPSLDCPFAMLRAGPFSQSELDAQRTRIPATLTELPQFDRPWQRVPFGESLRSPPREVGWDKPGERSHAEASVVSGIRLPCAAGTDAAAVFDMGTLYSGHIQVEIDAPVGAVVDVTNVERLREDSFASPEWMIGSSDRFIARGGRQLVEGFHQRGGRYVQVTVRASDRPVELHRVAVRETAYPISDESDFTFSDPMLDWVWSAGCRTLAACLQDTYVCDVFREFSLYCNDMVGAYEATLSITADTRLIRRCFAQWMESQQDDGAIEGGQPRWHAHPNKLTNVYFIRLLRDYWARTGDSELLRRAWPVVVRAAACQLRADERSGLWNEDNRWCDHGATREVMNGENGPLNAQRYRMLLCAAELAVALGRRVEARGYAAQAAELKSSFQQALWDDAAGCFADSRIDGKLSRTIRLHTNILALAHGLVPEGKLDSVLAHVLAGLEENPLHVKDYARGHVGAFFFNYVYHALAEHGQAAAAERAIRRHYGPMRQEGSAAIWEHFSGMQGELNLAICASPVSWLRERTLGVRQPVPGKPDTVLIAPESETLDWARGVVPHRRGAIRVDWRIDGRRLLLRHAVPKGVRVAVRPAGRLAALDLRVERTL
jgi:hypothetical protein